MKDYEQTFCIEIINDTDASEDHIDNIFAEMMNEEYGQRNSSDKVQFIKNHIDHDDIKHIDALISAIGGDSVELLELFDADYDDLDSMQTTKDKWEDSDYADEINGRIEELSEDEDY